MKDRWEALHAVERVYAWCAGENQSALLGQSQLREVWRYQNGQISRNVLKTCQNIYK